MKADSCASLVALPLPTDDGIFVAEYGEKGLCRLHFPNRHSSIVGAANSISPRQLQRWHQLTRAAVRAILTGNPTAELPPMDLSSGTKFQQSVWRAMQRLKLGQTQSYGEIAAAIGCPKGVRAVGGACGANPIPLLVPCHRVLAANQKLGGFSSGLDWKRKLLAREGILFC